MSGEIDWAKLIPRPSSKFLQVACPECDSKQIVFLHSKTKVTCKICGAVLADPSSGKAKIMGKIVDEYE